MEQIKDIIDSKFIDKVDELAKKLNAIQQQFQEVVNQINDLNDNYINGNG